MGRERDEETGRFTQEYPDEDFLEVLSSHDGGVSTSTVADEVGCAYRTAHDRLSRLESEELVTSRRVANALLWDLADEVVSSDSNA